MGESGSGKTTIVDRILQQSQVKLIKSVSATTRAPRKNEVEGDNYYFLSSDEFARRRHDGDEGPGYEAYLGTRIRGAIYDALRLEPGMEFPGPAIIEDPGTTIVIHPGDRASIDRFGNVRIDLAGGAA